MDESALQLQQELRDSVKRAFAMRRPILSHLNADTTWLLQIPCPKDALSRTGHSRFNILIDPWLRGPQSDVASWFSKQWHAVDSSVQTISELQDRLKDIDLIIHHKTKTKKPSPNQIDLVICSHEFSDHCHKESLLEIDPNTPVFATPKAADLIRSWNHFLVVRDTPSFSHQDPDWRSTSIKPLPHWLGVSRLVTDADALYYHSAILITFNIDASIGRGGPTGNEAAEAIIYTPHGMRADDLRHLPSAQPPLKVLALLHGLHDISISITKQLNLGAYNGLRAQRMCSAKYWVGTHDEVKKGGGIIAPLLRRKVLTLQQAIEKEKEGKGPIADGSELAAMKDVQFAELRSGESLLMD
ncbi:Beta-lactamase-like [Lasallia pustulata]|uniref:Beta-lactamase-like n=1 Tax=Lasallia pustulata TaxID=136370 RepID=A0A1W5DAV2_9LECA|nr:Beta-lactamase-like [Lasallia pustulata]